MDIKAVILAPKFIHSTIQKKKKEKFLNLSLEKNLWTFSLSTTKDVKIRQCYKMLKKLLSTNGYKMEETLNLIIVVDVVESNCFKLWYWREMVCVCVRERERERERERV